MATYADLLAGNKPEASEPANYGALLKQYGPKPTGNLLSDVPKMLGRGLAQLPEAIASPLQAGAGYIGKLADTAMGEQGIGPAEANINYSLGTARDYTTRALANKVEQALPYSQGTQQAQQTLGKDVQGITNNPDLGIGQRLYQSGKAALLNPRGSLPSVGESVAQFLPLTAALKGVGLAGALKQSVAGNALLEGHGGSQGAREDIAQTDLATLRSQPQFQNLEQRYGTAQAVKVAQEQAGSTAYLPAGVLGGAASLVTGGGAEGVLLGKLLNEGARAAIEPGFKGGLKYATKEVAKGLGREVPEETLQGASGQFSQNLGEQAFTGTPLAKGVPEQAASSGVAGLFSGGAYGGAGAGLDIARGPLSRAVNSSPAAVAQAQAQTLAEQVAQNETDRVAQEQAAARQADDANKKTIADAKAKETALKAKQIIDEQQKQQEELNGTLNPAGIGRTGTGADGSDQPLAGAVGGIRENTTEQSDVPDSAQGGLGSQRQDVGGNLNAQQETQKTTKVNAPSAGTELGADSVAAGIPVGQSSSGRTGSGTGLNGHGVGLAEQPAETGTASDHPGATRSVLGQLTQPASAAPLTSEDKTNGQTNENADAAQGQEQDQDQKTSLLEQPAPEQKGAEPFTPTHELSDGTPVIETGENTYVDALGEESQGDAYTTPIATEKTQQKTKVADVLKIGDKVIEQGIVGTVTAEINGKKKVVWEKDLNHKGPQDSVSIRPDEDFTKLIRDEKTNTEPAAPKAELQNPSVPLSDNSDQTIAPAGAATSELPKAAPPLPLATKSPVAETQPVPVPAAELIPFTESLKKDLDGYGEKTKAILIQDTYQPFVDWYQNKFPGIAFKVGKYRDGEPFIAAVGGGETGYSAYQKDLDTKPAKPAKTPNTGQQAKPVTVPQAAQPVANAKGVTRFSESAAKAILTSSKYPDVTGKTHTVVKDGDKWQVVKKVKAVKPETASGLDGAVHLLEQQIKQQKLTVRILANAVEKNKTKDISPDAKLPDQKKHQDAEQVLRKLRQHIFNAEDAAKKVVETNDSSHFDEYKGLFPDAHKHLIEFVSSSKETTQATKPEQATDKQNLTVANKESPLQKKLDEHYRTLSTTDTSKGLVDAWNVVSATLRDNTVATFLGHIKAAIEYGRVNKKHAKILQEFIDNQQANTQATETKAEPVKAESELNKTPGLSIPDGWSTVSNGKTQAGDYTLKGVGTRNERYEPIKKEHIGHEVENFFGVARALPEQAKTSEAADLNAMFDDLLAEELDKRKPAAQAEKQKPQKYSQNSWWSEASPDERKAMLEQIGRQDVSETYKNTAWEDLSNRDRESINNELRPAPAPRTAGQATASAAVNSAKALGNAIDGLGALFGGGGRLSSGLTFDEDTYAKAKPLFIEALRNLKDANADIREAMRTIIKMVLDKFGADVAHNMKPYVINFVSDIQSGKIDANAKQEQQDEHNGNGGTGKRILEEELPGTVPKDDQGGTTGRGSRGGSGTDKSGNGLVENGGDKRTGGLGSVEGTIPADETGTTLDGGLERELADEDYSIDDAELGYGTYGEKLAANMAAIRLVKQLGAEKRLPTQEEKAVLSNFIGWGALKNVFDTHSKSKQDRVALAELKTLLNENELFWAGQGVLAQHFTSPEVIGGIYDMLAHLGFKGGNVLEPTVGTGNFIGLMPVGMKNSSNWYASEIDPIVGNIAKYLYPESTILAGEGFEKAEFPYEKFDLAIGNPPFGDERITDKVLNRKAINRFKIHNYILAKSAMHLKPGGVMAFVVTNRFLDTKDAEARQFLSENFNMLAAIRLPNTAFKKNAGTEVTTDIIFLQKRIPGQPEGNINWLNTNGSMVNEDGETIRLNQYFADNPALMLGTPTMKGTMYGSGEQFALLPTPWEQVEQSLGGQIFAAINSRLGDLKDLLKTQHNAVMDAQSDKIEMNRADVAIGGYILEGDHIFMRQDDNEQGNSVFKKLTPATPWTEKTQLGEKKYKRIKGMLILRAKVYNLIEAERSDRSNIETLRKDLNAAYDAFVAENGYLNSRENYRLMAGDVKIEYGLEVNFKAAISAQVSKKTGFSASTETADKAAILRKRLFYPYQEVLAAANATDGYSISMSERGRLDLDYIAGLTGLSKAAVIEELSGGENPLIFKDPKTGDYIQEDEYLSGNVKRKLEQAKEARGFEKNVAALTEVQPEDIKQDNIFKDLGQTWIPRQVYQDFLSMLGITNANVSIDATTGNVGVNGNYNAVASAIGTGFTNQDYSISELFNLIANKKALVAYDTTRDSRVANPERTKELQGIAKRMTALFRDWIFADTLRADDLVKLYNKTQNTTAPRKMDGKHLRTIGANAAITLRDTQKTAAWRMIQQPAVLLDHVVGAGKTMTIIAGIMERRRLGLSKKPMIVVPNHLVSQWSKEFFELYPGAKILAASEKDFSRPNRRRLFARIATGDYDAIIVGHSSFKFIPVEREIENQFVQGEVRHLNDALEAAKENEDKRSVRAIKNRIAKRLQRLAALNNSPSDDVASFQQMGIDYLTVDESHAYKNLEYATGMKTVPGMGSPEGSQQAFDMYMKLRILLDQDKGGVTFATGTPISNSLVEMYSIMRYLNKQGLQERGIESFDAWAKNYASVDGVIEYMSTGKLKERTIMGSFNNVPEMMQLYNEFADTVTMDDLKRIYSEQVKRENAANGANNRTEFPVPKVKGGGRQLIKAEPSQQQLEYIDYLIERSLNVEADMKSKDFDPKIDNTLWVYGDAKKAALDLRILDPSASDNPDSKVNKAIDRIKVIYHKWHKDSGTQLVFIDLSTPSKTATKDAVRMLNDIKKKLKITAKSNEERTLDRIDGYDQKWRYLKAKLDMALDNEALIAEEHEALQTFIANIEADSAVFTTADSGFSVYDDMKTKLVAGGIPEHEVQFIHSFDTAVKKKELFALVNSGKVRILLGSTAKMGAGTNVQERLVALHHIDASQHNRPSDIEQREGRIIRQGNKLYERDPEGFEIEINAYSTERTFDAVSWQTLAKKAKMLESFRTGARSVEEDQGDSKGYMEFMAETTGNPIFREKIKLESEIAELEASERRLTAQLAAANNTLDNAESDRRRLQNAIDKAQTVSDAVGDANTFELDGKTFTNDYQEVWNQAYEAYREEYRDWALKLEKYNIDREEYDKKEKGKRGKAPSKPVSPNPPNLGSESMDKSSAAQFFRKLIAQIGQLKEPGDNLEFKIGGQEFYAHLSKGWGKDAKPKLDIADAKNIRDLSFSDNTPASSAITHMTDRFSKYGYLVEVNYQKDRQVRHEEQIKAAEGFVKSNKFEQSGELKAKQKRFKQVRAIVDSFEENEAERREQLDNKYIREDIKRFPDGKPRPKPRAAVQPDSEPEQSSFENIPGYGHMRPFQQGDNRDDAELVKGYGWMIPANKDMLYSKAENPTENPHSKATLTAAIHGVMDRQFGSGWTDALLATGRHRIIDRKQALLIDPNSGNARGFYNTKDGVSYLVSDNLSRDISAKALLGLMEHEISVHQILANLKDSEFKVFIDTIKRLKESGSEKVLAAYAKVPKTTPAYLVDHETFAEFTEANTHLPLVKKFIAWLRAKIREMAKLFPVATRFKFVQWANNLSENDLIYAAREALRTAPMQLKANQGNAKVALGGEGILASQSAMKSVDANIRRGREAMTKALLDKTSVHRAMFRTGMGWVDFVWGSEGGKETPDGKRPGAKGIAHIIEARQRKDRLSDQQAEKILFDLADTIAKGAEFKRNEIGKSTRVGLRSDGNIVWLTRHEGSNAWMITGYKENPDGRMAGRATHAPTQSAASLTRDELGAGKNKITQPGESSNNDILYSIRSDYTPEAKTVKESMKADRTLAKLTPRQRLDKAKNLWATKVNQKVFDRYRSFRDILHSPESWMLSRLSGNTGGVVEMAIEQGHPELDASGAVDINTSKKSLLEAAKPLQGEIDDAMLWMAALRAEKENAKADSANAKQLTLKAEIKDIGLEIREMIYNAKTGSSTITAAGAKRVSDLRKLMLMKKQERKALVKRAAIRERYITPDKIRALKTLTDGVMADGANRADVYEQFRLDYEDLNNAIVKIAVDTGTIDKDEAQRWSNEGFYVPFFRFLADETSNGPKTMDSLANNTAYHHYKGSAKPLDDILVNVIGNWAHLIDSGLKNQAAAQAVESAVAMGLMEQVESRIVGNTLDGKPIRKTADSDLFIRDNGKKVEYRLTDSNKDEGRLVLDSLLSMNYSGLNNVFMTGATKASGLLRFGVVANPAFKARNLIRDTLQALAAVNVGYNPLSNVYKGWNYTKPGSETITRMIGSAGAFGDSGYLFMADSERMLKHIKRDLQDPSVMNTKDKLMKMWDAYADLGARLENVNRAVAFEKTLTETGSLLKAANEANDLLAFQAHGSSKALYELTRVVPFLNAGLQGIDKMIRSAGNEATAKRFWTVTSIYVAASVILALTMAGDDDYDQAEEFDKESYHLFKIPGVDHLLKIPRPFEIGAMASIAERIAQQLVAESPDPKFAASRIMNILGSQMRLNPVPQVVKPILEIWANKSMFSGRDIESQGLLHQRKSERAYAATALPAKGIASALSLFGDETPVTSRSPVEVEHLINAYLGWLGGFALSGTDAILRPLLGETQPSGLSTTPFLGKAAADLKRAFVADDSPRNTAFTTTFYDNLKTLESIAADMRHAREMGDSGRLTELKDEYGAKAGYVHAYRRASTRIGKLNKQIERVWSSQLTGDEKRARIDAINKQRNQIAKLTTVNLSLR